MQIFFIPQLKDDASFQEFLDVHQNVGAKPVWTNDSMKTQKAEKELKRQVDSDDESDDADDDDDDVEISKSGDEGIKFIFISSMVDPHYIKH